MYWCFVNNNPTLRYKEFENQEVPKTFEVTRPSYKELKIFSGNPKGQR